jgi:cytochrome b pre-mRNA-processing protein 3
LQAALTEKLNMLNALRAAAGRRKTADSLAFAIASRAREPVFYREFAVPDTLNGRFDMVALHGWLVLERLEAEGARNLSQALIDRLFLSFENALREQGAGDIGMNKRLKKFASAFYGRLSAYGRAAGEGTLAAALQKNAYGENPASGGAAERLAAYALALRDRLAGSALSKEGFEFGPIGLEKGSSA